MAAYEVLLLNTTLPQIQAAQSGDTYVVPRDITFSTNATFTTGTANGVMYLNGDKVVSTGSLLTFNGTTFTAPSLSLTNALSTTSGGTGLSSFTAGDLTYYSTGTALSKLAIGTANQVLTSSGTAPQWTSLSSIGVTSVSFGSTGLTPSSATAGAVSVAGTLVTSNGGTGLSSYTAGDLVYYSTGTALSKLAIGTASQILTSSGSAPQWSTASGISVGTATNLAGGAAGSVPYQSGAGATTFLSIGAANQVLTSTGSAPQWVTSLTGLTGVSSSSITNTALTSGRVIYSTTGGAQTDSASLTFDGTTFATTTVDTTNLEVTNIKAKDGTAAASIADSTGVISITSNPILSGGTANGVLYLNGSKAATSGSALTFDGATLGVSRAASSDATLAIGNTTDIYTANYGKQGNTAYGATAAGDAFVYISTKNISIMADGAPSVIKFSAGGNTEGMRLTGTSLYTASGINVGIGTSSPGTKLHVANGDTRISQSGTGNIGLNILRSAGTTADWYNYIPSGSSDLRWFLGADLLTLTSSGNLGLGVTPSGYLANKFVINTGTDSNNGITIASATNRNGSIWFADGTTGDQAYRGGVDYQHTTDTLYLYSGGQGNFQLTAAGNLGLGVTPSAATLGPAFQIANGAVLQSLSGGYTELSSNAIYNSGFKYISSSTATLYEQGAGAHKWYTAPSGTAGNAITFTQAMTLDASGNLGVGTTSPGALLHVAYNVNTSGWQYLANTNAGSSARASLNIFTNAGGGDLRIEANNSANTTDVGAGGVKIWNHANAVLSFGTNALERARIDSSGNLLVGVTSGTKHNIVKDSASDTVLIVKNTSATTPYGQVINFSAASPNDATRYFLQCTDSTAERATIRSNGGLANYSANDVNLSDRREKTNLAPAKSYLDTICAIPVQTFNYIDQSEDDPGLTLGVVAQDVQAVAPELVMESNWGTKEEPKMRLSIYQTDLQYALMKCIQEQQTIIQSLTARIAALESKGV